MKTNHWSIPLVLTFIYFGFALVFPIHAEMFTGLIRILLLSFAALCSLLLWVSYIVWSRRGASSITGLLLIGLLLPLIICGIPAAVLSYRSWHVRDLDARIKKEAVVIAIEDEEVLTERGNPIGVRVRYEVRYPRGAEALISQLPPANLSSAPLPYAKGFWVLRNEIHALNATDYSLSSDIVPDFMPPTVRFGIKPGAPESREAASCFQWLGGPSEREAVLNASPQAFRIYISEPEYSSPTRRSYSLRRFYEGALKDGARECSG